jgi:hypothetical protein
LTLQKDIRCDFVPIDLFSKLKKGVHCEQKCEQILHEQMNGAIIRWYTVRLSSIAAFEESHSCSMRWNRLFRHDQSWLWLGDSLLLYLEIMINPVNGGVVRRLLSGT